MTYKVLADTTAIVHLITILAVIFGLLVSFRYKRFRPWEALLLVSIFILWSYYGNCPLAILEQYFRQQAGQHVNITSIGFIPYYAHKLWGINVRGIIVRQTTFYSSAVFFGASIEWFKPFFHREIFIFRKKARSNIKRIKRFV